MPSRSQEHFVQRAKRDKDFIDKACKARQDFLGKGNPMLTGFRTIIFNILVAPLSAWLVTKGVPFSPEEQVALLTLILAGGNLVLRYFTTTAIGQKA